MTKKQLFSADLTGDVLGGLTAMLIALPSAIAFGIILYSPLGLQYAGKAAVAGMIGVVALGLVAPFFGGTPRLITAPCAPAAVVLAVFVVELVKGGSVALQVIPFYVMLVALLSGIIQLLAGLFSVGKFIKYIPYPVVAGYLNGVGLLILLGQIPGFFGVSRGGGFFRGLLKPSTWHIESLFIGLVTVIVMLVAPKFVKRIPAVILALLSGAAAYFCLAMFNPALLSLIDNPLVIGSITSSGVETLFSAISQWSHLGSINIRELIGLVVPVLTLSVLLSIDTLKTCVILDVITQTRHNSNKELVGQGIANMVSSLVGGIPGAGAMGPTLINIASGAKTNRSSIFSGVFAALVLFLVVKFVAWIPLAALAGVLMVIAVRMLDKNSLLLLKSRSTIFDFFVILAVVISAVSLSLVVAAAVGTFMAIILFLREQIRSSVVRRKFFGNQKFSKKRRVTSDLSILESKGKETVVCELQGPLFFGTTDQLFSELEPYLSECLFVVLDMRRVQSLDFTGANMLRQIHNRVKERQGYLILTSIPLSLPTGQNVRAYLSTLGFEETGMNLKIYPNLDAALEWIEDEIIAKESGVSNDASHIMALSEFEFFVNTPLVMRDRLSSIMIEKTCLPGEKVFSMGDRSDEIYFLRKGTVKIDLPLTGGTNHHLLTLSQGDYFGEMSFLDRGMRSAEATAVDKSMLYVLSRNQFEKISEDHPEVARVFFEHLAKTLSVRLRLTNKELMAIEEE